jgi:hypothetical protein
MHLYTHYPHPPASPLVKNASHSQDYMNLTDIHSMVHVYPYTLAPIQEIA